MLGGRNITFMCALRQVVEKYREGQQNVHCVFIDMEKAYDRVLRAEVWNCLRMKGVPEGYVRLIQDMYRRCTTQIRCATGVTMDFEVNVGVHRGSVLSPLLFNIVMDFLTEEVRLEAPWNMMFADDVVLCTETKEEVEEQLESWRRALEDRELKVNRQKTEYLYAGEGTVMTGSVKLGENETPRGNGFRYLGSTVQADGGLDLEVEKRIQAGWNNWRKLTGALCDKRVPLRVKSRVYKFMVLPAMMYGLETAAITKTQGKNWR